jgi:hypothetical protein
MPSIAKLFELPPELLHPAKLNIKTNKQNDPPIKLLFRVIFDFLPKLLLA